MTQDEIIEMVMQIGGCDRPEDDSPALKMFVTFAKLVAAKEREKCAEICDGFYLSWINIQGRYEFMGEGASECADAIRARGHKGAVE